ncbi:hypothetical protein PHLCEN_2v3009 [Hermanssonia centrifuga]|uniref:Uncharacterized protein n=1 Tax=Hermanssonia centrifuga TaxID=98765 RepID=A0A2R6R7F5_9APHY|nr:hypothetical protein PHLCEN_2v3009 [Hermanssonia centrifuga]
MALGIPRPGDRQGDWLAETLQQLWKLFMLGYLQQHETDDVPDGIYLHLVSQYLQSEPYTLLSPEDPITIPFASDLRSLSANHPGRVQRAMLHSHSSLLVPRTLSALFTCFTTPLPALTPPPSSQSSAEVLNDCFQRRGQQFWLQAVFFAFQKLQEAVVASGLATDTTEFALTAIQAPSTDLSWFQNSQQSKAKVLRL